MFFAAMAGEKIAQAVVIIICLIFIVVSIALFSQKNWTPAIILGLLGGAGIGGTIYWMRRPVIDPLGSLGPLGKIFGRGEFDGETTEDCHTCGGEEFDTDLEMIDDLSTDNITSAVEGAHETEMHTQFDNLIRLLDEGDASGADALLDEGAQTISATEDHLKQLEASVDAANARADTLAAAYQKLDEGDRSKAQRALNNLVQLTEMVGSASESLISKMQQLAGRLVA